MPTATTSASRLGGSGARRLLRRGLDGLGLAPHAYDARARLSHAFDRQTQRQNEDLRASGAPDGLPLPPSSLVYKVAGHFSLDWYYASGASHAALLRDVLAANDHDPARLRSLLDFGCGCGRVIRHWRDVPDVHGSDANPRLVEWCRRALPFATFEVNSPRPPLRYDDEQFELVYAISVFTHLTEELQHAWMSELVRVIAPGGLLAITTKGRSRLDPLDETERKRFQAGELVVRDARYSGRNLCAAFHPERYVRESLANGLEVLDFHPATPDGSQTQDVFLLRKPSSRDR